MWENYKFPSQTQLERKYDLVVVGAGPAGSLTAALAAKAGMDVLLLEKRSIPRHKTCGGLISDRALSLLPPDFPLPLSCGSKVNTIQLHARGKTFAYIDKEILGIIIKRSSFDALAAWYAVDCGARLIEEASPKIIETVKPVRGDGTEYYRLAINAGPGVVKSRCIVGAYGAAGLMGFPAGLHLSPARRLAGWGYSCIKPAPENQRGCIEFFPLPLLGGMGWSFPGRGFINHGVGGLGPRNLLRKQLHRLFPEAAATGDIRGFPLPFTGPVQKVAAGNLLLVGDAAGLIDPFSGEGVYNAFKSAHLAVQALSALEKGVTTAAVTYNRLFRDVFRKKFFFVLAGAALYHLLALAAPGRLPCSMAAIMHNRHLYSCSQYEDVYNKEPVKKGPSI